jgi:hypothetical protein
MTTLPAVNPGDPVCHIAVPGRKVSRIREILARASDGGLHGRVRDDLATNVAVSDRDELPPGGKP